MKIVKVTRGDTTSQGVVENDTVIVLADWVAGGAEDAPFTLPQLSVGDLRERCARATERVALSDVQVAVPIDPKRKIICVGMNYRDHTAEIKFEGSDNPVLFTRSLDSLVADNQSIVRPNISETFDFEGEIAIVIGKPGRNIPREEAKNHIFGYSCFFDGSIRQYQKHSLIAGKNFWHSGGMGPWIVTADEIGDIDLPLTTRLNGEQVQHGKASQMIFGIAEVIAYCSIFAELKAGDVIATGTPGGVGARREPPLWMKPGDRVEVEIGGVGILTHTVVAE